MVREQAYARSMITFTADIAARLDRAIVVWLTTVSTHGQPQSSPVWFLRDGDRLVVYSLADAPRVRNVRANPRVALNLNCTDDGSQVLTMEGRAVLEAGPPSTDLPAYQSRYRALIASNGWTPERFARDYPQRIVITPTAIRAW